MRIALPTLYRFQRRCDYIIRPVIASNAMRLTTLQSEKERWSALLQGKSILFILIL